jgi:hypothetical protein
MKGIIAALFILCCSAAIKNVSAQGRCYPKWYVGSNIYGGNDDCTCAVTNLDTLMEAGESIWITVSSQVFCDGECSMDYPETYTWTHKGETISSGNFLVEDTGTYTGIIKYASCGPGLFRMNLRVKFKPVPQVSDADNAAAELFIYPTLSTGVFNIKSGEELAKVQVRDCTGKLVFSDSKNVSMIDLSHLREGIYFYYLEDKSRHSRTGKLVKR